MSSIRVSTSASSTTGAAASCPSNCSIVRASMIAEVIAGWVSTKAIVIGMSVMPVLSGELREPSDRVRLALAGVWERSNRGQRVAGAVAPQPAHAPLRDKGFRGFRTPHRQGDRTSSRPGRSPPPDRRASTPYLG